MSCISCRDLVLGYDHVGISEPLNFQVNGGDYLYVVGENGVGKSTLIKTLLHLIPPVSGEISLGDGLTKRDIGYLPQRTEAQKDFPATVEEIVLSGALARLGKRIVYPKKEKEKVEKVLERLEIQDLRRRCFAQLSGGQQQKVLLARALMAASSAMILDEPVTGLDPAAQFEMYQMIEKLNQKGTTIIMISHDIKAVEYASHVLHMSSMGDFFGTITEYKQSRFWRMYHEDEILQRKGGNSND